MRFKIISLMLICQLLTGCTHMLNVQYLQEGKKNFNNGDFKIAFRQMLPLASENVPEAEYAVGYMYYYGYGVAQDTETGIFWIKKAAAKNYKPAVQALAMMSQTQA